MEWISKSLFLLQYVSILFLGCSLQYAYGDHFYVTESATCTEATDYCMTNYEGVLAYEPHLELYEQETGCSTAHLAIWLWNRQPYSCKFRKATNTSENETMTSSYEYTTSSSASASSKIMIKIQETHRYICVTNGVMGKKTDLCNPKSIQQIINMEQYNDNIEAIIGLSVGAVAVLSVLVLLVILYKRRTRERPTPYWPHTSNEFEDGTKTPKYSTITKDVNDHHYTLPKTTSSHEKMVKLVRPALRKTTDVRTWASEADLYSLPYLDSTRPHRGVCFTTSVGSKSEAVSAPDIHMYETIKSLNCTNQRGSTFRCNYKDCKTINNQYCPTDVDRGYIEFFSTSGAASAPDLHLYDELKPCGCTDNLGNTCSCNKYTSLRLHNNPLRDVSDDVDFRVISGSVSAPELI